MPSLCPKSFKTYSKIIRKSFEGVSSKDEEPSNDHRTTIEQPLGMLGILAL